MNKTANQSKQRKTKYQTAKILVDTNEPGELPASTCSPNFGVPVTQTKCVEEFGSVRFGFVCLFVPENCAEEFGDIVAFLFWQIV